MQEWDKSSQKKGSSTHTRAILTSAFFLATLFAFNFISHKAQVRKKEQSSLEADLGPKVKVAIAGKSKPYKVYSTTAAVHPRELVTIYGLIPGYLKEIRVDRGDKVKKGDVIAVIDSSILVSQLDGARAEVAKNKAITKRMHLLYKKNLASAEEYEAALSQDKISQSKLGYIQEQISQATVRAPLDGVIIARYADVGAMIQNATFSQTTSLPIVTISQHDHIRLPVYVGHKDAPDLRVGQTVFVQWPEHPESSAYARISRTSGEMERSSGLQLVEVDLENFDKKFMTESFLRVDIQIPTPSYVEVPAAAVMSQKNKFFAAVVDANNTVHFREVKIAETDGTRTKIVSGVSEGEIVALNAGSGIKDGTRIQPIANEPDKNETKGAGSEFDAFRVPAADVTKPSAGPSSRKP